MQVSSQRLLGALCAVLLLALALTGCAHTKHHTGDLGHDVRAAAYAGALKDLASQLKKHPEMLNAQPNMALVQTNNFPKRAPTTPPFFVELEAQGYGPLHMAVCMAHEDVVLFLLGGGADVNLPDKTGATPLHVACNLGLVSIVQELLDGGADVNAKTAKGSTPLHWAAIAGDRDTVLLLVQHDADVNAHSTSGETPLHLSLKNKHPYVTAILSRHGAKE